MTKKRSGLASDWVALEENRRAVAEGRGASPPEEETVESDEKRPERIRYPKATDEIDKEAILRTPFGQVLMLAIASGRGELLGEGALPDTPEEVQLLVTETIGLINALSSQYRRTRRMREASLALLGAMRGSTSTELAKLMCLSDSRVDADDPDAFRAAWEERKAELLNQAWPLGEPVG